MLVAVDRLAAGRQIILNFVSWHIGPQWARVCSLLRLDDYTQLIHTTLDGTPLDE
jgi:hypothetical protein